MHSPGRSICCIVLAWSLSANASAQADIERLLEGEILFQSLQGRQLDALLKLNTAQAQLNDKTLPDTLDLTGLQLSFGLSDLTEQALQSHASTMQDWRAHNLSAYQLAWFYHHSGEPMKAMQALDMIKDDAAGISTSDFQYLRALAYLGVGNNKAAAKILQRLPVVGQNADYVQYNLALAQLHNGNEELATSTLASLGRRNSSDTDILALKDLANLKLGYHYLQSEKLDQARDSFSRIRLDGPFTDQALLGAGWTSFSMGQFKRAIVAWTLLHEKPAINDSVIEAKMALPYAYSKLGAYGKAANLYAHAIELFETETARLDAAIKAVRNGELKQAIVNEFDYQDDDWYTELSRRSAQQQFYLPLLLANDDFRSLSASLHELAVIQNRVEQAQTGSSALSEYAGLQQKHFAATSAQTDKELRSIAQQIKNITQKSSAQPGAQANANKPIAELAQLQSSYDEVLLYRKAAASHHQQLPQLSRQLSDLLNKLQRLNKKLDSAITSSAKQMESKTIDILEQKRKQLDGYRSNALFALAESYDFATRKQQ
jgi:hypothetical protein